MKRFWISWYQPTEDYRPLADPPNAAVLGWWCSGYRCSDEAATLCALVAAEDERRAEAAVKVDWPEAEEWRFCEERADDWRPTDRFPIESEWARERIGAESVPREAKR